MIKKTLDKLIIFLGIFLMFGIIFLPGIYLFSWGQIPGTDNEKLVGFLEKNYGIEWVKTAKIDKIDDGTIKIFTEQNSLLLRLNPEKTKVNLTIDDGRVDEFVVKTENGQVNIYRGMRDVIGSLVGILLNPLLKLLPINMKIFFLAAFTGLYASVIQKYTMDWGLMRRIQEKTKMIQKEMRQAQLSNNAQKIKKLEAQYAEMMGDQMEMFKQQFKPMIYISVISLPIFFWVYLIIFQNPNASMIFPFWGPHKFNDKVFWEFQYWLFWYFLCSIPVSQMTRKALNIGGLN